MLVGIFLAVPNISAQITLTQSSYPSSVIGTDSLKTTTYASAFPSLVMTAGALWDMSIITDTTPQYFAYRVPSLTSQFADSNVYSLLGYRYQGNVQSSVTVSAILEYGVNIEKVGYSISALTGLPTDSLFINSQNMVYSSPYTKIAFPATYNSSWSSDYNSDLNFLLSLAALSYSHAPCILRRYTTEKDSVTGWGKMRILDAYGSPSMYLNVLQVKTIITTTDSFFINGTPFSNGLLVYLSLTQGNTNTTYQQNYYRPQEVTPLAQVTFTDAAYTQPKSATTHVQRLETINAVPILNTNKIKIYPNPVSGNNVSIDMPAATCNEWSYELKNSTGAAVTTGLLHTNGNHAQFPLPPSLAPGTYYLQLNNNGNQICIEQIEVIR